MLNWTKEDLKKKFDVREKKDYKPPVKKTTYFATKQSRRISLDNMEILKEIVAFVHLHPINL